MRKGHGLAAMPFAEVRIRACPEEAVPAYIALEMARGAVPALRVTPPRI